MLGSALRDRYNEPAELGRYRMTTGNSVLWRLGNAAPGTAPMRSYGGANPSETDYLSSPPTEPSGDSPRTWGRLLPDGLFAMLHDGAVHQPHLA